MSNKQTYPIKFAIKKENFVFNLSASDLSMWHESNIDVVPLEMTLEKITKYIAELPFNHRRLESVNEFVDRHLKNQLCLQVRKKIKHASTCVARPFLSTFDLKYKVFDLCGGRYYGFVNKDDAIITIVAEGFKRVILIDDIYGVTDGEDKFVFGILSLMAEHQPLENESIDLVVGKCGVAVKVVYDNKVLGQSFLDLVKTTIDERYTNLYLTN